MISINTNFQNLSQNYLFAEIARRVSVYKEAHPQKHVISLGIGDVTRPLAASVIRAMHKAVDDEAAAATFHGYGPEQGYAFLRDKIAEYDYRSRGLDIKSDEIFISDGAKSDTGNITDLFGADNVIGLTDPVYPVYMDSNVMCGHAGAKYEDGYERIVALPCTEENGFSPALPDRTLDLIYLCYPNNPTGTTLTRLQLTAWVNYAIAHHSLLLFDAAYEAFITDDTPHSIYEIEGAKSCAIEFRSFSKTAGFTGVRLGYTVVPEELKYKTADGGELQLNQMWRRRQTTKFNGASYISQRGAEAIYTEEGRREIMANIDYYHENARVMKSSLESLGLKVYGGVNSPYLWVRIPDGETSWSFFDKLLNEAALVTTPGVGFGPSGGGFIRLTAFGSHDDAREAMERISETLG